MGYSNFENHKRIFSEITLKLGPFEFLANDCTTIRPFEMPFRFLDFSIFQQKGFIQGLYKTLNNGAIISHLILLKRKSKSPNVF